MKTFSYLPLAVQTEHHGELAHRRRILESDIAGIRRAARRQGIVFRSVRVTSSGGPDHYWLFSQRRILYNYAYIPNNTTPSGTR